jgi:hypothetical protein
MGRAARAEFLGKYTAERSYAALRDIYARAQDARGSGSHGG